MSSGTNSLLVLEAGGSRSIFSKAELETLKGSPAAIELQALLDKPADWIARHWRAARPFKFSLLDVDRDRIKQLRREERNPTRREDLIKEVYRQSHAKQRAQWGEDRKRARHWAGLVGLYLHVRAWLSTMDLAVRRAYVRKLEDQFNSARRNHVPSSSKQEERRRARERRELGRDIKRKRKAFGWRGPRDGRRLSPFASVDITDRDAVAAIEAESLAARGLLTFQKLAEPDAGKASDPHRFDVDYERLFDALNKEAMAFLMKKEV